MDTRVSDPDFANGIMIPLHDRLEYREFFFISGERHPASDVIAGRIIGVRYKSEWPMADEYDIIGAYEEEVLSISSDMIWKSEPLSPRS